MIIVKGVAELRQRVQLWRDDHQAVAFVPTMGNLHAGHGALMEKAGQLADRVVASIFVNPLQFGEGEDLDAYPRTFDADCEKLTALGVDLLFFPSVDEMYPTSVGEQTTVEVPGISDLHCGASRPGHFAGVATVVSKLFNMVQPDYAVFGAKDYQQLMVIRRLVKDLSLPVQICSLDTVREPDGLALSSRNGYLSEHERSLAPMLQQTLLWMKSELTQGRRDYSSIEREASDKLALNEFKVDYLCIVRRSDLRDVESGEDKLVILAAAYLGTTRLIDNITVDL